MDGAELTGNTRIERLQTLQRNYERHGIRTELDIVPGVGHVGSGVLPAVEAFFSRQIEAGAHL
ncbi:hypothetical protein D9M71_791100 [compost metagenome]